jgi:hypothetical protein
MPAVPAAGTSPARLIYLGNRLVDSQVPRGAAIRTCVL